MKFSIVTHGCKLNQFESASIGSALSKLGLKYTENLEESNIVIFNSCTVTDTADRKAIKFIKQIKKLKEKDQKIFIITGCFAQTDKDRLINFNHIDLIVDNKLKHKIPEIINNYLITNSLRITQEKLSRKSRFEFDPDSFLGRTRGFLKIQDGCNRFCSFCKVPFARGGSISLEFEEVIRRFKKLLEIGFKEIVITGVNITNYYWNGLSLKDLIKEMINIKGEFRVRLSSIMPDEFDLEILEFVKTGKLCPHLHISLQSGSDYVIKLMKRNYTSKDLVKLSERARKIDENFGLSGDVIVGFPGEKEEHFKETIKTVEDMMFFRLHIFPFSPRRGTLASVMPDQVPYEVKKDRERILKETVTKISANFKKNLLNKYIRIIPEEIKENKIYGYADNYLRVISNNLNLKHNEFEYVKVVDIKEDDMTSVIAN
ncbi:MAG: tRNA (N(6)-L-threonylcarbamoyladenosine(37)-C(2))-methylthiotransferase MtaB [Brevinematia bacterium]